MQKNDDVISQEELEVIKQCYDDMPVAICIQKYLETEDDKGDFMPVYANDAFCQTMMAPKEVILSLSLKQFAKGFPDNLTEGMKEVALGGKEVSTETFPTPFNKYFELRISQYKYKYIKLMMNDITEKHVDAGALFNLAAAYFEVVYVRALENVCFMLYPQNDIGQCIGFFDLLVHNHLEQGLIHPDDMETVAEFFDMEHIRKELSHKKFVELKYRRKLEGKNYEWCCANLIADEKNGDELVTFTLSIKSIESIVKEERAKQKELENAMEAEKRASQTKDRFMANMSHDLRTPINGIMGMLELMEKREDNILFQREAREQIQTAAKVLLTMFNDALEITRIETSGCKEKEEVFDLKKEVYLEIGVKDVQWKSFACEHPIRLGNPIYIRQILFRLIENAMKFNKENEIVEVSISEQKDASGRDCVVLCVKDHGIGISKEFLPQIFEPFTQEHAGARTNFSGIGLGLHYVKKTVDLLKGTIRVESTLGEGSTFWVEIPLPIVENEGKIIDNKEISLSGKKVLLVEDNQMNMFIEEAVLEDENMIVDKAENGKIAVEKFLASALNEYQVILMDIMMPVMNGLDATRCIRQSDRSDAKTVPILAISANSFPEDVEKSLEAGMNAHLAKPINVKSLISAIGQYI